VNVAAGRASLRVLIVKLSSLGDVVHAMPVVDDIRAAHPGALIDWVVEPGFAPLVRRVDGMHRPSNARCGAGARRGGRPRLGASGGPFARTWALSITTLSSICRD